MKMYISTLRSARTLQRGVGLGIRQTRGFTLIEMLAVIVLIGLLVTVVVRFVGKDVDSGKYGLGKTALGTISSEIERYHMDVGVYPQSLNDLTARPGGAANWNGPYVKESQLKDPFGHQFQYKVPGEHGDYDLIFLGKDGQPGGEDINKDVGNWQ